MRLNGIIAACRDGPRHRFVGVVLTMLWCLLPLAAQEQEPPDIPDATPEEAAAAPIDSTHAYTQEQLLRRLAEIQGEESKTESREAVVSLFLDGKHLSDMLSRVTYGSQLPKVRYRDLKVALGGTLSPELMYQLGEEQDIIGWVSIEPLKEYGPDWDVDTLTLHLKTPAQYRQGGSIDLRKIHKPNLAEAIKPEPTSAFVNFYHQYVKTEESDHYRLLLEPRIRRNCWVVESALIVDPDSENTYTYHHLRATRDYVKSLARLTI